MSESESTKDHMRRLDGILASHPAPEPILTEAHLPIWVAAQPTVTWETEVVRWRGTLLVGASQREFAGCDDHGCEDGHGDPESAMRCAADLLMRLEIGRWENGVEISEDP